MAETLVVDCSVAVKWILPEPGREAALELLDAFQEGRTLLLAPDLLLAECASLLAKRVRRKLISAEQAREAQQFLVRCAPKLFDLRPLLRPALDLAMHQKLSLWDCVYIALGEVQDCPVITADRRLFRGGRARHPRLQLLPLP